MEKYIISEAFNKLSNKKLHEAKRSKDNSKYTLKVGGKRFPQSYGKHGIKNAFINNNGYEIKKIIKKLDNQHQDYYYDDWEKDEEINDDYTLWVNRYYDETPDHSPDVYFDDETKEAVGVFEIDEQRIKDVNHLYKYIDQACQLVNDGNADYIEVVTPVGNTLVSYQRIKKPISLDNKDIQYTDINFDDWE